MKSYRAMTSITLCLLLSPAFYQLTFAQEKKPASHPQVVLKGRVACSSESGHRPDAEQGSNQASRNYELLTSNGKRYKFAADDLLVPIFTESRVRNMDLQITALLHEGDLLELIKILAIKDGKLYDIYYFCDLCNITAYGPGPCSCCFQPLVFIEKPAK